MKKEIIRKNNVTGKWEHKIPHKNQWAYGITNNDNVLFNNDANNINYKTDDNIVIYKGIIYNEEIFNVSDLDYEDYDVIISTNDININELAEIDNDPEIVDINNDDIIWDSDFEDENSDIIDDDVAVGDLEISEDADQTASNENKTENNL